MLSNIKVYQSETASQHSPSQNSPCCTPGRFFTNEFFRFYLVAVMFVYINTKCSDSTV